MRTAKRARTGSPGGNRGSHSLARRPHHGQGAEEADLASPRACSDVPTHSPLALWLTLNQLFTGEAKSATCPPVSMKATRRQHAQCVRAWILVVRPPRGHTA